VGLIASIVITLGVGVYLAMIYSHLFGQFGQQAFGRTQLMTTDQPL